MKHQTFSAAVVCCSLIVLTTLSTQVLAQSSTSRRGGLYGDWRIKMKFGEREFESILSFSRSQEGQYAGQWISFFGMTELKDVKFEALDMSQMMMGGSTAPIDIKIFGSDLDVL